MSNSHTGNMLNEINREEHDGTNYAKRVTLVGNVSITATSNVTIVPQMAWPDPKTYIGLVTITGSLAPAAGNVTLDAGSKTQIVGNVTLSDPKGFIGLVTVVGSLSPAAGNVTLDAGSRTGLIGTVTIQDGGNSITIDGNVGLLGNVTISDSKGFIGLTTSTLGVSPAFIGIVTVTNKDRTITGNVTLSDAKTFIGLTTTTLGASPAFIGLVTVANASFPVTQSGTWDEVGINDSGNSITIDGNVGVLGNVTLSDAKTFIGLTTTTLGASPAFIGIVTIANTNVRSIVGNVTVQAVDLDIRNLSSAQDNIAIIGNVTLSDSKGFIGLVTSIPAYGSNSTVFTQIISTTGNSTVFVAPASNRFFIKNLHVSSLGRAEVEIRSGATTLIPFTSLSTTSGFNHHFGEQGLPARTQADAFVVGLNGAATISVMANVRFEA